MKKLLLLAFVACASFVVAQPQIVNNSWTVLEPELCEGDGGYVVENIAVYEPNIQSSSIQTVNTSNGDFYGFVDTYSSGGDTAFVKVDFFQGQTPPAGTPFDVFFSFTSDNGTSDTISITFILHPAPAAPTIDANGIGYFCSSDNVVDLGPHVSPSGGTFHWAGGSNSFNLDGTLTANGIFDPSGFPTGALIEDDIVYEITDGNGCKADVFYPWYNYVNDAPSFNSTPIDASSCSAGDGEIQVTPNGNTTNYLASIPTGDTITLSNGTQGSFSNLIPGTYFVTVADDSGCMATSSVQLGSADLSVTGTVNNTSCHDSHDGSIDLTVNTASNYTLYWEHGTFVEDLNNLSPGDYTVYVTDDNGCEVAKTFTVESPTLKFNPELMNIYDYDCIQTISGEIAASVIADNEPVTYSFPSGTMVNDSTYTDLNSGNYAITVTDANGCSIDTTINVGSYTDFDAYASNVTDADCGQTNGSVDMNVYIYNASSLDSYEWSNGATSQDLTNVGPGTYTFTMTHISNPNCDYSVDVTVDPKGPQKNPICLVTVDSLTTTNLVVWEREETTGISHYNIYRETNTLNQFQKIDSVLASEETMFNDVWASPLIKSWGYKISAVNDCGVESPKSQAHRTIHLRREVNGPDVDLMWNQYSGFSYAQHDIWRFTASTGWQNIGSFGYNTTSYTDTPPDMNGLDYAIEVDPGYVCESTKATSHNASRSNRSQGAFNPGEGTGASNNTVTEFDQVSFTMYPNPTRDMATLVFEKSDQYNITVYNVNGSVVNAFQLNGQRTELNTSNLPNGIYIVDVQNDNYKFTQKLVVSH